MYKQIIVLSVLLILPMSLYGRTADINLPRLIKICESFEKAVKDVNIEYTYDANFPPGKWSEGSMKTAEPTKCYFAGIKPFDQMYKMTNIFVFEEKNGHRYGTEHTEACDGIYFQSNDDYRYSPVGKAKPFDYQLTPLVFTVFYMDSSRTLTNILKEGSFVLDPNIKKVNDFNTVEVQSTKSTGDYGFWFSADHNYTVVKTIRYFWPGSFSCNVTKLKNLGNNVWFPTKCYSFNNEHNNTNTYIVNKVAINHGLTKKNLLDIPPKDANK
jgi:hypothetical protein